MDLQAIVNAAADAADDFLADARTMFEARPAIREYLAAHHPGLDKAETERVVAGLLAILDEEGFFMAGSSREALAAGEGDNDGLEE